MYNTSLEDKLQQPGAMDEGAFADGMMKEYGQLSVKMDPHAIFRLLGKQGLFSQDCADRSPVLWAKFATSSGKGGERPRLVVGIFFNACVGRLLIDPRDIKQTPMTPLAIFNAAVARPNSLEGGFIPILPVKPHHNTSIAGFFATTKTFLQEPAGLPVGSEAATQRRKALLAARPLNKLDFSAILAT